MPSFDVVSEVDLHAFTNAVDQASRVIENRFDFKGVDAGFERKERTVTLRAEAEFQKSIGRSKTKIMMNVGNPEQAFELSVYS